MSVPTEVFAARGAKAAPFVLARPVRALAWPAAGLALLLLLWWWGGRLIAGNPATANFAGFAPGPALASLLELLRSGQLWTAVAPSLARIGQGLLWAALIGVPAGVLVGSLAAVRKLTNFPFQLLRMISPLAWMPIAVLAFDSWDGAIVFLIVMAAVWPVVFSTAFGVQRIDPLYYQVARNFGADFGKTLRRLILPAVAPDIFAGLRLAVGVAWVVLVPAEYLGVTSGLGYAINDARDTLSYDRLAALVVVIGVIGYLLDSAFALLIRRFSWQGS